MQVKSIAEFSKRAFCNTAILSTYIKLLPFVFKTFVLSIFQWPRRKSGFTVFRPFMIILIWALSCHENMILMHTNNKVTDQPRNICYAISALAAYSLQTLYLNLPLSKFQRSNFILSQWLSRPARLSDFLMLNLIEQKFICSY